MRIRNNKVNVFLSDDEKFILIGTKIENLKIQNSEIKEYLIFIIYYKRQRQCQLSIVFTTLTFNFI